MTGLQDSISVNGKAVKVNYDGNARVLTKTSPEGRKTFSFFDAKGRIVKDTIPGLLATTYTFDNKGRKIEDNQGGRRTTYEYDTLGRQSKVTDPYGRSTSFFYDVSDRLVKTVLPDSSEVLFTYDRNGNMLSLTPPGKPEHAFEYSNVDLETIYTPPFADDSARTTARIYTLDKEPWKVLRPDSLNITMEYGGQGSLAGVPKKIYFDRGFITNLNDTLKGQQIGVVSAEGDTLKFVYDGSLVKQVSWSGINGLNSVKGKVSFRYNNDQQVITETVTPATGSMDSVNLQYDKDGLLTSVGLMKLKYGTNNTLLLSDTVGNIVTDYGYDTFGALSLKEIKIEETTLYRVDFVRDSLSRIVQKTENTEGNTVSYSYSYDNVGRLIQASRNDTLISVYTYDVNGNRLSHWTPVKIDSGYYDAQDRLLNYENNKYIYTQNGDLTIKIDTITNDTTHYSYDAFGALRSVEMQDGTLIEYLIDGSGKRIGRKVNGVVTQKWLYSSDLRIIAELDSIDQITSRFVYTTSENVPEYFIKSDTIYRIITDHLGSVRQVVNTASGAIIQKIDYDEFGNVLLNTNPDFQPFGYAGGLYDQHTKLVRFGVRDYDAIAGRWTNKDPIRFESKTSNLYEYVSNDPINYTDLTGRWNWSRIWHNTINNWNHTNDELLGFAIPGIYTLAKTYLQGKTFSDINWMYFTLGVIARGAASSLIGTAIGYPGIVGFFGTGMAAGFAGAGGALVTSTLSAFGVAACFEAAIFVGSFMAAIISEVVD